MGARRGCGRKFDTERAGERHDGVMGRWNRGCGAGDEALGEARVEHRMSRGRNKVEKDLRCEEVRGGDTVQGGRRGARAGEEEELCVKNAKKKTRK